MVNIDTIEELIDFVKEKNEIIIPSQKVSMKVLKKFYDVILINKNYKGKYSKQKKLIVKINIIRKLMAWYDAKMSYCECNDDTRRGKSQEAIIDLMNNKERYKKAYNLLDDDSKGIYILILLFKITGNYEYIVKAVSGNQQYFSDKIEWKEKENIIDCGAFIGDTLEAFVERNIRLESYYLYELEDDNFSRLLQSCEKAKERGVKVYPRQKGVHNESTTLYFEANADSSRLVDYKTDHSIQVVALDEDVNGTVTFIKMDIEGSELEALQGAKNIIKRDKPTLAICLYHKQSDFWKIPLLIHEICPDYKKYWIEHYTCNYNETVLYVSL